jgi:hypothetical protein
MVRQLGTVANCRLGNPKNVRWGRKLGKELVHSYVRCTTIPRSRRRGASPAPWGSGGLVRPMGIKEPP